jgi:hypothetical protein
MSGTLNEQLNQIADTKCAIADAINSKGIEVSENDPFATYASKIKQIQGGEGGNAFNLFDIKVADHKLEGTEALGWAEQGTNVYKIDYPDFYSRCLQEYQQGVLAPQYITSYVLHEGDVTDNDGVLSNFTTTNYAKIAQTVPLTGNTWEIVFKVLVKSKNTQQYFLAPPDGEYGILLGVNNGKLSLYLSKDGTKWVDNNGFVGVTDLIEGQEYYFKLVCDNNSIVASLSTDKLSWTDEITQPYVINGVNINIGQRMGLYFWSGSVDLNECYININDQRWWTGTYTFECKKHVNEHVFFNIDNKYFADDCLSINNSAWFYGVDEQNEYIMLPRTNNFSKLDKRVYICVGNTVVDESTIDISKEIELNNPFFVGQSQYFENEPNNLSWLKSTGEFHSKELYPSMYEYISKNIKAGTKDFVHVNGEVNDYCYVIDEQNETFRLPLLNGSESIPGTEYINLSELSTGDELTAPKNGQYIYKNKLNKAGAYFYLWNINSGDYSVGTSSISTHNMSACVVAHRGDVIRYVTDLTTETFGYFRFIPYVGNGSLYYYVGEAINNAQLVDLGKITAEIATKVDINSDRFDGAWVSKNIALAGSGGASFSSSNVVYDLSEYLPNDGYNYEVIVSSYISTAAKSGSYACVYIGSDIMTSSIYLSACITRTSSNAQTAGSVVCPVGYGRYIFVEGTSSSGSYSLYVRGYRRLGKI